MIVLLGLDSNVSAYAQVSWLNVAIKIKYQIKRDNL
jgi:hypothetical protein